MTITQGYTPHQAHQSESSLPVAMLVGSNLCRYPYMSAYGAMMRVCRLHVLPREMRFRYLGVRFNRHDDIPKMLATSGARKDQLFRHIGGDESIRTYWDIEPWLPFSTSVSEADLITPLRICPCCSRSGYHTILFHLPWVDRCPWHGARIVDQCPSCSRPLLPQFIDADLVPHDCPCGVNFFDVKSAIHGDPSIDHHARAWQASYLAWANEARTQRYLVAGASLQDLDAAEAGVLADLPLNLRTTCSMHAAGAGKGRVQVLRPATSAAAGQTATDFLLAMKALPVTERAAINVPPSLLRSFRAVAQNIVEKLPARTFFEGDLLRIYPPDDPGHRRRPPGLPHRQHAELTFLPLLQSPTGGVLDCTSIDKHIRSVVRGATWDLMEKLPHAQDGPIIRDLDLGTRTVLAALGKRLLLHGYAQGIRIILGRHVATLYDLPRDRPRPRRPIAIVFTSRDQVTKANLIWVKAPAADA
ncbi:hypothetical protein [Rhodanobacter sp. KK11]|jgi:hypothetical protein|uniref:hypothetical protein n=1 Tax=Rhodanobacter sp. KK11 TaxID=3083255 RepID=UPI002966000F|nr:hypothetical protein [Rhodanobacter sp. KK11]MDW2981795.1 hypothetical protein [Rhodanobacter sp. KK11]